MTRAQATPESRRGLRELIALVVVAPWIVWLVIRLGALDSRPLLVKGIAFTPYAAAAVVVPLLLAVVLRAWIGLVCALLAALGFALVVVPRARPSSQPGAEGPTLSVMTLNTRLGHADSEAITRLVRRHHVQVLALEELPPTLVASLQRAGLFEVLDESAPVRGQVRGGSRIFASVPITRRAAEPGQDRPSDVVVTVRAGVRSVQIRLIHPPSPTVPSKVSVWQGSFRGLTAQPVRDPSIIAGDLNATLDNVDLRRLMARGYRDAADEFGAGLKPTFRQPPFPPITIDHVLVSRSIAVRSVDIEQVPGTDHRAVISTLQLP